MRCEAANPMQERRKRFEENPRLAWIFWSGHGAGRAKRRETMNDVARHGDVMEY